MRLLFIVSSMGAGGAERVASNLANAWADAGHSVCLALTYSRGGASFYPLRPSVKIVPLIGSEPDRLSRISSYFKRVAALRRLAVEFAPDVAISFMDRINVAAGLMLFGLNIPLIVSERVHPPCVDIGWLWSLLRRITYPRALKVVMLSREGLHWLQRTIPHATGAIIPNAVEYPLPRSEPILAPADLVSPEQKVVLAVGRFDSQKGYDILLTAFSELAFEIPGWTLVILGDGHARNELEHLVHMLGISEKVILPGRAGNVGDWYERCDIFVLSSRFEGFPNTLLEAMAYGCAAVSFDCDTGPRDIIVDGQNGVLVKPVGDNRALADAMRRLMKNDGERHLIGTRALDVRERYSKAEVLKLWSNILQLAQ